jgi:hypothetical protein
LGAKILLDLVEVFFHFGYGAGGQRDEAGQVSHVHDVDAAGPALQLPGPGVQRAAGGRLARPTTRCWNLAGGTAVVMGTLLCFRGVSGQTLMRSFLAFLTGQPRVREG